MLATTQTLEEKEHDFRQSVLTGVFPKLMTSSAHSNYVDLTNAEDDDDNKPDGDKQLKDDSNVKQRKSKVKKGLDISVTNGGDVDEEALESAKKKKKRKTEDTSSKSSKKMKA